MEQGEIYKEKISVNVNEEDGFHEAMIRGLHSNANLVLRNVKTARALENGKTYELVIREIGAAKKGAKAKPAKAKPAVKPAAKTVPLAEQPKKSVALADEIANERPAES